MMERGILDGKFHFKKLRDGSFDKTKATDCHAEFSYHRSTSSSAGPSTLGLSRTPPSLKPPLTSSLNSHVQAKHTASSSSGSGSSISGSGSSGSGSSVSGSGSSVSGSGSSVCSGNIWQTTLAKGASN